MNGNPPSEYIEAAESYSGKGRMPSARLIALDKEAIAAIRNGEFLNARAAANHFLPKYGFEGCSQKQRNNRVKDIAKRLEKKMAEQG